MKKFVNYMSLLMLIPLVLVGCQTDRANISAQNPETAITANSEVAALLTLSAQNDGTVDDFIDGLSATSVTFPYVVDLNGQLTTITSESSLQTFKQTVQASGNFNPISLVFPVKVRSDDHSEKEVRNEAEFEDHLRKENEESENEFRGRINCFRFNFPITLLTFNTNQEQTGSVVVNDKKELFAFFTQLPSSIVVNIQYPISITFKDETTLQIENNEQLRRVLLECRDDDKIGDDDTIDDDIRGDLLDQAINLQRALLTSDWVIAKFMNNGNDRTAVYQNVKFEFFRGGAIKVSATDRTAFGRWEIEKGDNNGLDLELKFRDEVQILEVLDDDWKVANFTNTRLELAANGDVLIFEGTPNGGVTVDPVDPAPTLDVNAFKQSLTTGSWSVANFKQAGVDITGEFSGFSLSFTTAGVVTATRGAEVRVGTWFTETSFTGLELNLAFENISPIDELDEDWLVIEFSDARISLKHTGDSGFDELIFEKN
ncbi:MAG: hypothetical protein U1C58_06950 [Flavobacteriaceae bacterium]|nr:hypothetical protein [Flavobacteriaceae bacterium]MDZ4148003.1 hypothetical protein [Flavobacteriaceae bacterium]